MGTDAACDATLEELNKGFTFADAVRTGNLASQLGLACAHFIMFGGPGENQKTFREELENIDRLEDSVVFAFTGIRILPETGIFKRTNKEGLISGGGIGDRQIIRYGSFFHGCSQMP